MHRLYTMLAHRIIVWVDSTPTNDWDGGDCEDENCHGLEGALQTCLACFVNFLTPTVFSRSFHRVHAGRYLPNSMERRRRVRQGLQHTRAQL